MTLKIAKTADGTKVVLQAGDFKINGVYQLTGGYHSGCLFQLEYISAHKQVMIDGVRHRLVNGTLVGEKKAINTVLAHLQ
jgi:hypothetical protein